MTHMQGSLPSRMSREGAARTYHMYTYWGYFNRRMSARRQLEQKTMPGSKESTGIAFGDNSKQQKSYYGEMTNVWRYFENVPDAISDLRTKEAAQVADRHLRSVFSPHADHTRSPKTCFCHILLLCRTNLYKESTLYFPANTLLPGVWLSALNEFPQVTCMVAACRALFGDQEECLTTLLAWQQMTNEARWFGRALYDAEEIVLQSCRHHMTEQ